MRPTCALYDRSYCGSADVELLRKFSVSHRLMQLSDLAYEIVIQFRKRIGLSWTYHRPLPTTPNHICTVVSLCPLQNVSRIETGTNVAGVASLRHGPITMDKLESESVYPDIFGHHTPDVDYPVARVVYTKRPNQALVGRVILNGFKKPLISVNIVGRHLRSFIATVLGGCVFANASPLFNYITRSTTIKQQMPAPLKTVSPTDKQIADDKAAK